MAKRTFKTRRKLTTGPLIYRKWVDWDEGDVLVGKYLSKKKDLKYGKLQYTFEVLEADFKDRSGKKVIGKNLCLNETGMLKKALAQLQFGEIIQIAYNGTAEIEGGKFKGKDSHTMDIDVVTEDDGSEDFEAEDEDQSEGAWDDEDEDTDSEEDEDQEVLEDDEDLEDEDEEEEEEPVRKKKVSKKAPPPPVKKKKSRF